ncbi:hypothetical protein GCM10020229_46930 [Kitasatospora albolonga]|uniref:hypothetical protein n=1 Tax=Kitasatospora albolonga TaxID=68173 RepID=UPI0031E97779
MVDQAYVQAGDVTEPAIATLRDRLSQAIDDTVAATALDRAKVWLQMPVDSTFFNGMLDSLCGERAKDLGERLSPGIGGLYNPADLAVAPDIAAKWEAIGGILHADRAVTLKGPTWHVGGAKSGFLTKDRSGFHVIVLLATGQEPGGRRFVLALDPDVSATSGDPEGLDPLGRRRHRREGVGVLGREVHPGPQGHGPRRLAGRLRPVGPQVLRQPGGGLPPGQARLTAAGRSAGPQRAPALVQRKSRLRRKRGGSERKRRVG